MMHSVAWWWKPRHPRPSKCPSPTSVKVHLAFGYIDMRKGIDGLAMLVQGVLRQDPFSGRACGEEAINFIEYVVAASDAGRNQPRLLAYVIGTVSKRFGTSRH
jgi:hypothetical protein